MGCDIFGTDTPLFPVLQLLIPFHARIQPVLRHPQLWISVPGFPQATLSYGYANPREVQVCLFIPDGSFWELTAESQSWTVLFLEISLSLKWSQIFSNSWPLLTEMGFLLFLRDHRVATPILLFQMWCSQRLPQRTQRQVGLKSSGGNGLASVHVRSQL